MTQGERIVEYMQRYGSITPMEAFADLGITKLATRIGELRRDGVKISKTPVERKNRYGKPVRYMQYSLEDRECADGCLYGVGIECMYCLARSFNPTKEVEE